MKRGASLWSPVEKDERSSCSGIYTYETVTFVERKNYNEFSCQDIKNGNQIIIQSNRFKIH
jgi:hypothetical protein